MAGRLCGVTSYDRKTSAIPSISRGIRTVVSMLDTVGDTRVLEGHAFRVEAAVSLGGHDVKPGLNIFRFANRIPLLFEVGLP